MKLSLPVGFDVGRAVCLVDNADNSVVLNNLLRRVDTLLNHTH